MSLKNLRVIKQISNNEQIQRTRTNLILFGVSLRERWVFMAPENSVASLLTYTVQTGFHKRMWDKNTLL